MTVAQVTVAQVTVAQVTGTAICNRYVSALVVKMGGLGRVRDFACVAVSDYLRLGMQIEWLRGAK